LAKAHQEEGLAVLAVNAWDEPKETLETMARKDDLKHRILLNGGEVFTEKYGLKGVPQTFWIDRSGKVAAAEVGFEDPKTLDKKTARLLGGGG
jgi:hypothetical protein